MTTFAVTADRIFDGEVLHGAGTVVVTDGLITAAGPDVTVPDGAEVLRGATLLPGLIDAHVHLSQRAHLDALAAHGVTTAVDMASWPPSVTAALRAAAGTTQILSAGVPFIGPGGPHAQFGMPGYAVLTDPAGAAEGVARRVADGSDLVKIVLEAPGHGGPSPEVLGAVVAAAHDAGRRVVAHATHAGEMAAAVDAGVDVLTHVPMGVPVDAALAHRMAGTGRVVIPTLSVAAVLAGRVPGTSYDVARDSVAAMREAGVTVLAGTDSVEQPGIPFTIPLGATLHGELELLAGAGYSPVEVLRAATSLPARCFGLDDRGRVAPGLRADLLLVDGDPGAGVGATRGVRRVWVGGRPV
ncbi:amidohydrolase family protein [Pseudonocardia spirodelae]|uniref:Amidohydrolase family protein n=1 Tax=Pseudonocardia spirodelae TaxID=3133431 RepID=A0ABU8TB19_9PSEU